MVLVYLYLVIRVQKNVPIEVIWTFITFAYMALFTFV